MSESTEKPGPYTNKLRRGENLMTGWGYINEIRPHQKGDKSLLFISIGLQCGWKNTGGERPEPVYQNIELLVGKGLERTLSMMTGEYTKDTGKPYGFFQIRNLVFEAVPSDDQKAFLNNRGILETVTFGQLDE